eukprot:jgi/Mesvir1/19411/Mv10441-RA.1
MRVVPQCAWLDGCVPELVAAWFLAPGIRLEQPIARLLVNGTAKSVHAAFGDGGLFSLYMASRLVALALERSTEGAARLQMTDGFNTALQWCAEHLSERSSQGGEAACSCPFCPEAAGASGGSRHSEEGGHDTCDGGPCCCHLDEMHEKRGHACCPDGQGTDRGQPMEQGMGSPLHAGGAVHGAADTRALRDIKGPSRSSGDGPSAAPAAANRIEEPPPADNKSMRAVSNAGITELMGHSHGGGCGRSLRLPIRWDDLGTVLALVRTVLAPKKVACLRTPSSVRLFAVVVAQAFIASLPSGTPHAADASSAPTGPCVRILPVQGPPPDKSCCIEGVLLDTPCPPNVLPLEGARVALFGVPLDLVPVPSPGPPATSSSSSTWDSVSMLTPAPVVMEAHVGSEGPGARAGWAATAAASQLAQLKQLADQLKALGVTVVGCQKLIHPHVKEYLLRLGMLPLERLSILHIGAVARLSGALVAMSPRLPASRAQAVAVLGWLGRVQRMDVAGKSYLHLVAAASMPSCVRAAPVTTLVVCALSEAALDELAYVTAAGCRLLERAVQTPVAVPGGGCFESLLAHHLRSRLQRLSVGSTQGCKLGSRGTRHGDGSSHSQPYHDARQSSCPGIIMASTKQATAWEARSMQPAMGAGAHVDPMWSHGVLAFAIALEELASALVPANTHANVTEGHTPGPPWDPQDPGQQPPQGHQHELRALIDGARTRDDMARAIVRANRYPAWVQCPACHHGGAALWPFAGLQPAQGSPRLYMPQEGGRSPASGMAGTNASSSHVGLMGKAGSNSDSGLPTGNNVKNFCGWVSGDAAISVVASYRTPAGSCTDHTNAIAPGMPEAHEETLISHSHDGSNERRLIHADVLDLLSCKMAALQAAVEVAVMALRVDSIRHFTG